MNGPRPSISRSLFVAGYRCLKLLWYRKFASADIPASEHTREVVDQHPLRTAYLDYHYPNAIRITSGPGVNETTDQLTRNALARRLPIRGAQIVHEDTLTGVDALARVEVLVPISGGQWDAYVFARGAKPTGEEDLGLRYALHVLYAAGIPVSTGYLLVLNTSYRRQGDLDATQLYRTHQVSSFHSTEHEIRPVIAKCRHVFEMKEKPVVQPGSQCSVPSICPLADYCWISAGMEASYRHARDQEGHNVFASHFARIEELHGELPPPLPRTRKIPAWAQSHPSFLTTVTFPIFCVGIRSIRPPIPLHDGKRPFQQIPYLYSIHVLARPDAEPHAYTWLASGEGDTGAEAFRLLREDLWESGTVIVADARKEDSFLYEAMLDFPEHRKWHENLSCRITTYDGFLISDFFHFHKEYLKRTHMFATLPPLLGEDSCHTLLSPEECLAEFRHATNPAIDERARRRLAKALQYRYSLLTLAMATRIRMIPEFETKLYERFR